MGTVPVSRRETGVCGYVKLVVRDAIGVTEYVGVAKP